MTAPTHSRMPTPPSGDHAQTLEGGRGNPPVAERGSDAYARRKGRDVLLSLYGALRNVKLYPPDNAVVQKSVSDLIAISEEIIKHEHELELRISGEFVFLNGTRLRVDMDNYATIGKILQIFRDAGIGVCRIHEGAAAREWYVFLQQIQSGSTTEPYERRGEILAKLDSLGILRFEIGPSTNVADEFREKAKEAAKRVYAQSVLVTKEVINSLRLGQSPSLKKIKRVVQGIVDQILNEESSLIGLTTLRDYDEYTFTHSVNVCIFAVALGRKLGLTRLQLYDLGIAALMHDIGKTRVPVDVLTKPTGLTEDEWRVMASHPWLGVLTLFQMRGQHDMPYRAMVVAFEHHKRVNLTGYPKHIRPRDLSIYSKIVSVVDCFDAATTRRTYQSVPLSPADVLQEMRSNVKRGMDQAIVKAFMSLVGHYPVGTLVVLDTLELAVVVSVSPAPDSLSRPTVRVISDTRGHLLFPGTLVDLSEQDAVKGGYVRTIIKIADPERYGIRISDYFV
ncbi:MAG: HD domain-containing protein [Gemmatimonadota bacterium]|nr:HD domain-containing protein [Gemmatimonadota bacterium]